MHIKHEPAGTTSFLNTSLKLVKPRSVPVFNVSLFLMINFKNFSRIQLVSRLPPLRYRLGLSDPPKAVAPRSVRCAVSNLAPKIVKLAVARAENHTPMWIQFARAASFLNALLKLVKSRSVIKIS